MQRRAFVAMPVAFFAPVLPEFKQTIRAFGLEWDVLNASDWKVTKEGGIEVLELAVARPQEKDPRTPIQYALARTAPIGRFTLELEMKPVPVKDKAGHMIAVYAWRDNLHFNYVHLSADTGKEQPVHNGIFHVYGGDRVRISQVEGPRSFPAADWTRVKIAYDASQGMVETSLNGQKNPALRGVDLSLAAGRIGLGSFFHTGSFRNFKLTKQS